MVLVMGTESNFIFHSDFKSIIIPDQHYYSFTMNTWTQEEQMLLKQLKEQKNAKSWTLIAEIINERFGKQDKNGKQCRERYINFVRPGLKQKHSNAWSPLEEDILFQKYAEFGAKWTFLSSFIETKSENSIKNKFYGSLRKLARKLNEIGRHQLHLKKDIKYQSILKPLQSILIQKEQMHPALKSHIGLRKQIISLLKLEDNIDCSQATIIIKNINKFNLQTRSLKFKKKKTEGIKRQSLKKLLNKQMGQNSEILSSPEIMQKKEIHQDSQLSKDPPPTLELSHISAEQHQKNDQNACFSQQKSFHVEEDVGEMVGSSSLFFSELFDPIDIYLSL